MREQSKFKKDKTEIDNKGRVCCGCGIYKPWHDESGKKNYHVSNHSALGYSARCKDCLKIQAEHRKLHGKKNRRYGYDKLLIRHQTEKGAPSKRPELLYWLNGSDEIFI